MEVGGKKGRSCSLLLEEEAGGWVEDEDEEEGEGWGLMVRTAVLALVPA